jgi:DNA-binding HxlR family transcriptional regulator
MKNIDVEIYKQQFMDNFPIEDIAKEYDCEDESFQEVFESELDYLIELNMIEHDDPKLTMDQFEKLISTSVTKFHLENLVKEGLVEANFDVNEGENVYSLTEKGKETGNAMFN